MEGRVIKSTGSWYNVQTSDSSIIACRLKGKFKLKGLKVTNPLAVGDAVNFEIEEQGENTGVITHILPRKNYIIRKSPHKTQHGHIIASNVDQAILISTLVFPKTSLGFIDRFLVSAESFRIKALVVFNKADIYTNDMVEAYSELATLYTNLGYETMLVSAEENEGLEEFKAILQGKTSLLSGHSGVGKSTIINKLIPDVNQRVSKVSDFAQKGTHTTTFAEMFSLNPTSYLIDTPGIKEWGLMDIENTEISHFFPELRELMGKCKFYNCSHTHEPSCAILEAFNSGKVSASRYESYLSMLENDDNRR